MTHNHQPPNSTSVKMDNSCNKNIGLISCQSLRKFTEMETLSVKAADDLLRTIEGQQCLTKLKELYEKTVSLMVEMRGKPVPDAHGQQENNLTEDFAAANKAVYFNEELVPAVENTLQETCQSRKHCPHQCASLVKDRFRKQRKYLELLKPVVGPSSISTETMPAEFVEYVEKSNPQAMHQVATAVSGCGVLHDRLQQIELASVISESHKHCVTDDIIFQSKTVDDGPADSTRPKQNLTLLNSTHLILDNGPPLKRLRPMHRQSHLKSKKSPKRNV